MSLLSVTVKKARYVGVQIAQFNTYVTLKLQNVKSTTVTVKGPAPCWEQDFLFEINDINLGLLVEVWNKGVIWDRAIGYHYMPLASVAYDGECGPRWVELEAQCMMRGGTVVGTTGPTGHALLLDCRFEPPFDIITKDSPSSLQDAEGTVGADLQRKLDLLNGSLDAERAEQARRQMQYIAHSGYSEDSDYTSDLNYPVGQHPNCSASQFRSAAHQMHTPQRSLEVSRENSYERDEYHLHGDTDPLYYNSQPRSNRIDTWSQLHAQASVESAISWRTATDWQSAEDQRLPSLERQNTLYDESIAFGFDNYISSTHTRDHSHISNQPSYEEYFDSSSYPYQTSYVGDDSRQWDSGGRFFYEDIGMTNTQYENLINKRRSSIVQLPQVPPKQQTPSSRYSDYNEMTPYRPRPRRTAASLPATPSSTPKRVRALPMPPGSETGSLRGGRRRLPKLPHAAPAPSVVPHHVPYLPEPEKTAMPDLSYSSNRYGYQSDVVPEPYQEPNFSATYDEDGMQPFFDETPHATPPAATQKSTWSEVESTTKFSYPVTTEDTLLPKTVPSIMSSYAQPVVAITNQDIYQHENYQHTEENLDLDKQQPYSQFNVLQQPYQELQPLYPEPEIPYEETLDYQFTQELDLEKQAEIIMQQKQFEDHQMQQRQLQLERQLQQQQPKQPAQQIQASVLTGAATLGSLMAGGAKKLGSFFGAAAAAVAAPTPATNQPSQMTGSVSMSQFTSVQSATLTGTTSMKATSLQNTTYMSSVALSEESYMMTTTTAPFINTTTVLTPETIAGDSPLVPVCPVTTSTPVGLHKTPSLRRQESILRPTVRRTRTLPDAPEDLIPSNYDDSAYEDEYSKTELNLSIDRDMTSLDRYNEDEFVHDSIQEDVIDDAHLAEEPNQVLQKVASPTRTGSFVRKPSVDSYHSTTPSLLDRKTSQSSFHPEDKLTVPVTQEEAVTEKTKVTFKDDRTTYHEVPEDNEFQQRDEQYREDQNYAEERENFRDENEKFEAPKFNENQEHYQGEEVFPEQPSRIEQEPLQFQPEQPKLTAKQRWHRAYNKIVMQLNVSTSYTDGSCNIDFIILSFSIPNFDNYNDT